MTPYIVGRRANIGHQLQGANVVADDAGPTANLRAENSGNTSALRTLGWSAVTFGAGAILGWLAAGRIASGRLQARQPRENL